MQESINVADVITFCLDLMSKLRRNLIKITSCAIFSWLRVSSYFNVDRRLPFRLVSKEIRNVFIVNSKGFFPFGLIGPIGLDKSLNY